MRVSDAADRTKARVSPIDLPKEQFRALGHALIEQIADFYESLPSRPVTRGHSVDQVRALIGSARPLPADGTDPQALLSQIAELLFDHSLHNGHPRFWGYVTSSAAPIGALADLLAAAVNPNAGGWKLSPVATEIEVQTVRWLAELIGYPTDCGGLLVSGGNMANFVGILAGRRAKADWDIRASGMAAAPRRPRLYASAETHTWIQKAADLFGFGTDSIVWIPGDDRQRINTTRLREAIDRDRQNGNQPFMVIGTAGSVSTGAVDPLRELSEISRQHGLWFHVDGAYGAFAAAAPGAPEALRDLALADSVAMDPHKWLYAPLEAGCVLVRKPEQLRDAFSYHPPYYHFDPEVTNYFDLGPQNSRGFRALKVWLALQQVGREGYAGMISEDIALAEELYSALAGIPDLERKTQGLSIVTFRYVPPDLREKPRSAAVDEYLDELNRTILDDLEASGEAFLSNAVIEGRFYLRLCIVNFRTSREDIEALPGVVLRIGKKADLRARPSR